LSFRCGNELYGFGAGRSKMNAHSRFGVIGVTIALILGMAVVSAGAVDLKEGVEQLAVELSKTVSEGRTLRVAVTDFADLQGVVSDLGRYIAERLTTRLSAQTQKFRVIERRRLGQVLGELRFSMFDLVDPNKAKQLGKMLGVEAIVVGTVSDLGNVVDIDTRVIEIETNHILPGTTAAISKDDTVRQMMERGREMPAPPSVGGPPPGAPMVAALPPAVSPGTVKYQDFPKFRVEVYDLRVGPEQITAFLRYINKTQEEIVLTFDSSRFHSRTYLLDREGNRYDYINSTGMAGGWEGGSWFSPIFLRIPPKESVPLTIQFRSRGEKQGKGTIFDLISAQFLVEEAKSGDPKVAGSVSISVSKREPR
jgi:TolB-like protein